VELIFVFILAAFLVGFGGVQLRAICLRASETLAIAALQQIGRACYFYYLTNRVFPSDLLQLTAPVSNPPYLAATLAGNGVKVIKDGYAFTYLRPHPFWKSNPETFQLLGGPLAHGQTGERHFYIDQRLAIFCTDENRDATPTDSLWSGVPVSAAAAQQDDGTRRSQHTPAATTPDST
jgi:hypothetical protein